MPAEYHQTYAYWIRNLATDSQLEAIQKDGDRIRKENAALTERVRVLTETLESALKTAEFERHPFRPWHRKALAALRSPAPAGQATGETPPSSK